MRVLIFTEGGSQIGLGHVSRCSSLYDELEARGIEVEFIIFGDTNHFEIINNKNFKVINWLSTDFLNNYIKENDYCIVDSYLAAEDLYRIISDRAKKSLFIDDNGRMKYPKGIIVNPSFSKAVKYPKNDASCYLLGPKYIILRKPFIQVKRETINSRVEEVLITLGGSDIHNLTPIILEQICRRYPNILFNIIIGNAFENINEIKNHGSNTINFYENATAEEMKTIMLKSDFAITAAGQTIYELIATQTPFIPIKIIENQDNNIAGLKEFNLVDTVLDYRDTNFLNKLQLEFNNLLNEDERNKIITMYENVIDGLGDKRIVDRLVANQGVR